MSKELITEYVEPNRVKLAEMVEYVETPENLVADIALAEDVVSYSEIDPAKIADAVSGEIDKSLEGAAADSAISLPGADFVVDQAEAPQKETNWIEDRDVKKFMGYIVSAYPDGIPKHDGKGIVGCERAYNYLNRLNREISEAIRMDTGDDLQPETLENIRVNMMKDMVALKNRISDLKQRVRDTGKVASEEGDELIKEATTPRVQIVATPFQRAIVGILINSVVSGGKPFEDVYSFLKNKYGFDSRDELSIMQLAMDSGFPIFKDRGLIGASAKEQEGEGYGIDFLRNYLA